MKRRLSRIGMLFLKVILGFLAVILLMACSYVLFNTPLTSSLKTLSNEELQTYANYLDTNLSNPQQFVAEKFDHYDVVLLGEMHWKKQDVVFRDTSCIYQI